MWSRFFAGLETTIVLQVGFAVDGIGFFIGIRELLSRRKRNTNMVDPGEKGVRVMSPFKVQAQAAE